MTENLKQNLVNNFAMEIQAKTNDLTLNVFCNTPEELKERLLSIRNLAADGLAVLDTLK